jgi:hypothetical protein
MTGGSASPCWASQVGLDCRACGRGSANTAGKVRAASSRGAGRRRTRTRALGRHPSRPRTRPPGSTAGGHVRGPLRIKSGAASRWGGGLTQMSQDRVHGRRLGEEGDDAHLELRTARSAGERVHKCGRAVAPRGSAPGSAPGATGDRQSRPGWRAAGGGSGCSPRRDSYLGAIR